MNNQNIQTITLRDTYWDIVKGILIFLVIFGHTIQYYVYQGVEHFNFWNDPLFKGIYIFHMPLFMLVSGYFATISFKRRKFSSIPRYLKRLAFPCLGIGLYQIIKKIWFGLPISPIRCYNSFINLWFLIVVFECFVFYIIYEYFAKNIPSKLILLTLPIIAALIMPRLYPFSLLWPHCHYFTFLWPFFITGSYIYKCNLIKYITDWKWGVCATILFLMSFFVFKDTWYVYRNPMNFSMDRIGINAFRYFSGLMGCASFLFVIKLIANIIKSSFIQSIGQATLALYILQTFAIGALHPYIAECEHFTAFCISLALLIVLFCFYRITRHIPIFNLFTYGESNTSENKLFRLRMRNSKTK